MNRFGFSTAHVFRTNKQILPRSPRRFYADYNGPKDTSYFVKELPKESFAPEKKRLKNPKFSESLIGSTALVVALFAAAGLLFSYTGQSNEGKLRSVAMKLSPQVADMLDVQLNIAKAINKGEEQAAETARKELEKLHHNLEKEFNAERREYTHELKEIKKQAADEYKKQEKEFKQQEKEAKKEQHHDQLVVARAVDNVTSDSSSSSSSNNDKKSSGSIDPNDPNAPAFDPETGKINWDCPCLGGMAYGVCGQQFRDAFSCFVYSNAEPQGSDCIEKFKAMQDCFRSNPDIYEKYLADEDQLDREAADDLAELVAEAEIALEN